jgi:hypothetical protein
MESPAQEKPQLDLPRDLPKEIPAHFDDKPSSNSEENHANSGAYYPKTLLSWNAPGRPFKKRGKQFFMTSILIALLLEIILFLFAQYMLMLVVVSLVFLSFSFVLVPPKNFHYKITTEGIMVEDHFYLWQEAYDFYFKRREGVDILMVRIHSIFPGELSITLGSMDKNHVLQTMAPYLPYREYIKPTFVEKSATWLTKTFPLEKTAQ